MKIDKYRKISKDLLYYDDNRRMLRLHYVRYADDCIILCNTDLQIAEKLKRMISDFLRN